jgi:hypothetical protein
MPLLALGFWYAVSFLPHVNEVKRLAERGIQSIAHANPSFSALAVAGETKKGLRLYAMRQAYWSLVFEKSGSSQLSWHANNALWYVSSYLHFREDEVFGIWA